MGILRPAVAGIVGIVALSGCAVGPKYHTPSAPVPPAYKEAAAATDPVSSQEWKVATPQDAMRRGTWWEMFDDPELNALEAQVNGSNQNIAQAYENYMAARALIDQARAQRLPTVTTDPTFQRSRSSATLGLGTSSAASGGIGTGRPVNEFALPIAASWEPDLWGRIRNTIDQNRYAAQVSAADLENVRLLQHSTLAQTYFALRGQDALLTVLEETVAADGKAVDFARAQYETGIGTRLSLVQAENALATAEAVAAGAALARAQDEHAIAVLVGKPPAEFSLPRRPLDTLPPEVPPSVPSELLERRPDIAAAERLMAEANAQLGLAYAAYYPTVTLSASAGFESSSVVQWFSWPSRLWALGASAAQTIFDGGLRRATVQQFTAAYDADVASYRQTVLTAFQQVEDSLAAERILAEQTDKQQQAVTSAQEFFRLANDRYQTGIDPYLNVLTAQTTLLSGQQALASLQTNRMTSIVQLIAALGGGWDRSQLP
ncbi:MAG TPA: efflux transporter outer membrane subunit [Vicinamibacterales bacterium]|jgi:NodT family efflux transporter outer membrane factor (OMF) lipoprotein